MGKAVALAALLLLPALAAGTEAPGPDGVWLNEEGTAAIQLTRRDGEVTGRIVWMRRPRDDSGALKRDDHNPDPAMRKRPLCGLPLMEGFRREGQRWVDGRVYNPRDGKHYAARFSMPEPDTLVMRGYVVLPVFGSSVTWHRAQQAPGACPEAAHWPASGGGG